MTAKDTKSRSQSDETLPFGALPDGDAAPKKARSKKAPARKKAASTKASKATTKKTSKKATKKKATKKASSRSSSPKEKVPDPAPVDAPEAATEAATEVGTKERAPRKKAATRRRASRDDDGNVDEEPRRAPRPRGGEDAESEPRDGGAEGVAAGDADSGGDDGGDDGRRRRRTRRGRRRKQRDGDEGGESSGTQEPSQERADADQGGGDSGRSERGGGPTDEGDDEGRPRRRRRRRRNKNKGNADGEGGANGARGGQEGPRRDGPRRERSRKDKQGQSRRGGSQRGGYDGEGDTSERPKVGEGMFLLDKGQVSVLRRLENQWLSAKDDVYVPKKLVDKYKLRDGMMLKGPLGRGYKHKYQLEDVVEIDGQEPRSWKNKPVFKNLTSIDPDFHYSVGDVTDEVAMRMVDLLSPIGRGQRGLLVAPPRSGKTTIMRQFAAGIEEGYPDVKLMVLLIDERPEEATEWQRSVKNGLVFASTADETAKHHINLAEVVWRRAMRLVEMGEDVIILLDSITRLARAYNNQAGSGRTMSGGLDSRAMERPRKIFGSARNTVEAGSLTILGTTLVDTGSRMDQLVFEEFKGTGNMELVLNRKLADRRIFPAIDIERTGTRKEEKLVGMRRLKLIHVLRRVLSRMHFTEAADLLITRLDDVNKTDDFLERFTVDPEA